MITHLQYLVLTELMHGDAAGHELRQMLKDEGINKSAPAFYQLMSRLEEGKWVKGEYWNVDIDGQICRERRYEITGGGRAAAEDYWRFANARAAKLAWEG